MLKDTKFFWLVFISAFVGTLEFFSLIGIRIPAMYAIPLYSILIILIGYKTLWHGLEAFFEFNFKSINALMLIAVIGAFYLGQYEEAAVVIALYTLAEKLEDIGISKSQSAMTSLLNNMPKRVFKLSSSEEVPVDSIQIGELILVRPFETVPLDGIVIEGFSYIDESTITGEPIPKDKTKGDFVFAGTQNKQGALQIEVLKLSGETTLNKVRQLILQASKKKAYTQKFIETFSQYYTPLILLLAFMWVFIPVVFFNLPFEDWLQRGLALLVIGCPCALVISTPVSIYSAIGNASRHGALIKSGRDLEAIGQIKAIAFDKTRTLTYGQPEVSDIFPFIGSKEHVLECAAGIEIFSEHPLSQGIVKAAKKENLNFHKIENYEKFIGKGAKADCLICKDSHHCIGKLSFIMEEHHVPEEVIATIEGLQKQGKTSVVIATHSQVEGIISLRDKIKPESKKAIEQLSELGIETIMLTGDHPIPAQVVADSLGINCVKAELLPEEKALAIEKLVKQYKSVAMVGDGINDAPALAIANVGISIGSLGSDAAIEAASIVLLHDKIDMIPYLVELGRRTIKTIKENITLAIAVKVIFILLALVGLSHLALAIFADVGVTLIVILLSLRLQR